MNLWSPSLFKPPQWLQQDHVFWTAQGNCTNELAVVKQYVQHLCKLKASHHEMLMKSQAQLKSYLELIPHGRGKIEFPQGYNLQIHGPTCLMLWPSNTVPHGVMNTIHKIIFLQLCNCNVHAATNHDVTFTFQTLCHPVKLVIWLAKGTWPKGWKSPYRLWMTQ